MEINIKTLSGKKISLNVNACNSTEELKRMLANKVELTEKYMRLFFNGKPLEDGKTLADYKIKKDSILHLLIRHHGGCSRVKKVEDRRTTTD